MCRTVVATTPLMEENHDQRHSSAPPSSSLTSRSVDWLRILCEAEIRLLRECYRRRLPDTLAPYLFVDNHLRWCERTRDAGGKTMFSASVFSRFYTLATQTAREELTELGTFVAITEAERCPTVAFWTLRDDLSPLKRALMDTAEIDWSKDPVFSCVHLAHYAMLQEVLRDKAPHLVFRNSTFFRLPDEVARNLQFSIPEGYELAPVDASHACEIDENWPHRYAGSEEYYRSLLRLNGGLALVAASAEQPKQLAGWILTNEYGALAHLFIKPAHRQRGLAAVLVRAWSASTVQAWAGDETAAGAEVIAYILDANIASRTLFQKLGFVEMSKSRWSNPTTN
uniref:N-acetyltransferase domain-containing protein n=1 Tax=Anopheles farauti TaxID=69004 RepID=A0A182QXB7_9DIPT